MTSIGKSKLLKALELTTKNSHSAAEERLIEMPVWFLMGFKNNKQCSRHIRNELRKEGKFLP